MWNRISYSALKTGLMLGLGIAAASSVAHAQREAPKAPGPSDVYCSAVATDQAIPVDSYLISGENSSYKVIFAERDLVYINRGSEQGVKTGDEFEVVREVHDMVPHRWFKAQPELVKAMGTVYKDMGRMRVVNVQAKTATAEVTLACESMQRGDIVRPFAERPSPAYHQAALDPFAQPSGKKTGMLVTNKNFGQVSGAGDIVFVNLGTAQGVQVGDYFRAFRYQGGNDYVTHEVASTAYKMYGFGSTPVAYTAEDLPRQVLGEGIVLRTGTNSATVLLTTSRADVYDGDYMEIE